MGYITIKLSKHGYAECCMCDICPICDLGRLRATVQRSTEYSDEYKEEIYEMIEKRINEMVDHEGEVYG
jgi:hypothetical protein